MIVYTCCRDGLGVPHHKLPAPCCGVGLAVRPQVAEAASMAYVMAADIVPAIGCVVSVKLWSCRRVVASHVRTNAAAGADLSRCSRMAAGACRPLLGSPEMGGHGSRGVRFSAELIDRRDAAVSRGFTTDGDRPHSELLGLDSGVVVG